MIRRREKIPGFPVKTSNLLLAFLFAGILLSGCGGGAGASAPAVQQKTPVEILFSPGGGCEATIVSEIGGAGASVHVLAYVFTSVPIADALIRKKSEGVPVEVVLDPHDANGPYSQAQALKNGGVAVFLDGAHGIMHDKVVVVDGVTALTGSYNFTWSAEHDNAENLVVFRNDTTKGFAFEQEYLYHRSHSTPY